MVTSSPRYPLWIDRPRALYGSWYEFFPRSIGAELAGDPAAPAHPARHGTLKDAAEHLDYVASLGFDVAYLPPIHPIGDVNRKGPNNTLVAASWDVGSPWAIGSRDGGHDAVHPELGTMPDFVAFVQKLLTGATVGLGALMGAIIAVPVTVAVLAPSFKTIKEYSIAENTGHERMPKASTNS